MKQKIKRTIKETIDLNDFTFRSNGTYDLIQTLQDLYDKSNMLDGLIILSIDRQYGYYDEITERLEVTITYETLETDSEYEKRIKKEEKENNEKLTAAKENKEKRLAAKKLLKDLQDFPELDVLFEISGAKQSLMKKFNIKEGIIL